VYQLLAETLICECIREIKEKGRLDLRLLSRSVRNVLNSLACHGKSFYGSISRTVELIFIFECSYHRRRQVWRRFIHESVYTTDESPGSMSNAVSVRPRTARYDAAASAGRFGEIARTEGQNPPSLRAAKRVGVLYATNVKVSFTKYMPTSLMLALPRRIE